MKDLRQRLPLCGLNHHVDVVGHNAPSEESVTIAIEFLQRFGNHCGDLRVFQQAVAGAVVEEGFYFLREEFSEALVFGRGQGATLLLGILNDRISFAAPRF